MVDDIDGVVPGAPRPAVRVAPTTVDQPAVRSGSAPEWLVRLAALGWRLLVVAALVAVLGYIAVLLATVSATILVSVIFAAAFAPLVLRLRARGWSRTKAAGVVTFGIFLIVIATLVVIFLAFVPYIEQLASLIESTLASLQASLATIEVPAELANLLAALAQFVKSWLTTQLSALLAPIAEVVTVGILSLFTIFFMLQDGDKGWAWAVQAGADWQKERITASGHNALERVGGYLRGLGFLAAFNAIRDFILLEILGVPLAGPLAVLVFILGFIPYFGGLIATALIVLVTWATVGSQAALVFLVVITIMNVFEGNVMMPRVYGKTVHIHPVVALLAILAGGAAGGILGVFIAIPLVAFALAITGSLIAVIDTQPRPETMAFIPGWLDRIAQWSWRMLVAIALLGLLIEIIRTYPSVVIPLTVSVILAATFGPLVERLVARGWRRGLAAIAVTLGVIGGIVALVVLAFVSLIPALREMVDTGSSGADSIASSANGLLDWFVAAVQTYGLSTVQTAATIVAAVGLAILLLIIATVLFYYFLADGPTAWRAAVARLPGQQRERIDGLGRRSVTVLSGYMIATGVISGFAAATQWLIMTLLGLPLALPLAVLAFFLGFIPYIGSLLSTGLAFLVTVGVGTPQQIAIMAIWTLVFNIVQGNIVAPNVYGRAVNLHPAVVLLAIPAGNAVAGVMGMFLVVPFLGIVAATWRVALHVLDPVPPEANGRAGGPAVRAAGDERA